MNMCIEQNRKFSLPLRLFWLLLCIYLISFDAHQTFAFLINPSFDQANRFYQDGMEAINAERFPDAAELLERSYASYPTREAAFALCFAYWKLNDSQKTQTYAEYALNGTGTPPLHGTDLDGARSLLKWAREKNQRAVSAGSDFHGEYTMSDKGLAVAQPTVGALPPPSE
jgi:hypothetical protein